jgi:chemotaxis protein methyltransferase CheR
VGQSDLTTRDTVPVLRASEFELISKLAYQHFGLDLSPSKQSLVSARLGKRLRELGLRSFREYYDHVTSDRTGAAMASMVDCLTTNHTSFFRELRHFDFLCETVVPELRSRSHIYLWSAACSSGEEPYSIAMSLLEQSHPEAETRVKIMATDISTRVLEKARCGTYTTDRVKEIPPLMLQRYLQKDHGTGAGSYTFKKNVRSMIEFRQLNLMDRLQDGRRYSVIFCRNIMIYFDKPTQQDLVHRMSAHLEDGGYLFIGHAESLNLISHELDYVSPAIYRKNRPSRVCQIGRI